MALILFLSINVISANEINDNDINSISVDSNAIDLDSSENINTLFDSTKFWISIKIYWKFCS